MAARAATAARFRAAIERMAPYVPGEQPRPDRRLIKLNTNENPYPPSPGVRRVLADAAALLHLYPPPRADELIAAAARLYRMPREMIVAGNGSDELLAMLFRATLGPGDRVAYPLPTYSLYDTLAAIQEARMTGVPWGPNFSLPLQELLRPQARSAWYDAIATWWCCARSRNPFRWPGCAWGWALRTPRSSSICSRSRIR